MITALLLLCLAELGKAYQRWVVDPTQDLLAAGLVCLAVAAVFVCLLVGVATWAVLCRDDGRA